MIFGIINRWCGNKLLWRVYVVVLVEENVFYRFMGRRGGGKGFIGFDV